MHEYIYNIDPETNVVSPLDKMTPVAEYLREVIVGVGIPEEGVQVEVHGRLTEVRSTTDGEIVIVGPSDWHPDAYRPIREGVLRALPNRVVVVDQY